MPLVLRCEWVGRRVVIRYALSEATPMLTDALGDLLALDDSHVVVQTRAGRVDIDRAAVVLARLVEPSSRDQLQLEAVAAQGWRAADVTESSDGWLLRADQGWTGRANSALPLRTPTRPLTEVLAEVDAFYSARTLPGLIQVPLPVHANLDRALAARGYTYAEDVDVLVARLDLLPPDRHPLPAGRSAPFDVTLLTAPDEGWLRTYRYRGRVLPANAAGLLTRHDRAVFAEVHSDRDHNDRDHSDRDHSDRVHSDRVDSGSADPIAVARGVVDSGWLGLTALDVALEHRRRGIGGALVRALAAWGAQNAATRCYLQVSTANHPAQALYRQLGFWRHHSYRYRVPPTIEP